MRAYAQTNVELYDQLRREGYSDQDISLVRDVYELAVPLFTCLFLPSGKLFIDHLVGTASVLAALRAPIEVVAAGLIHAAYFRGDFGRVRIGASRAKRRLIKKAVGADVEEYVAAYDALEWDSRTIPAHHAGIAGLDRVERCVLLIQLANELEHRLDYGDPYSDNAEWFQRYMNRYLPMMVDMAHALGFPSLAAELAQSFREAASAEIPVEARSRSGEPRSYLIAPSSYCKRRGIALAHECAGAIRRIRVAVGLRTRLRRLAGRFASGRRALGHSPR
jgi:(p)ppGpp synthase/HD superfamily hydrolase